MTVGGFQRTFLGANGKSHNGEVSHNGHKTRRANPVCCILGASFGTGNLGVNALASSTVGSILSSFPQARIFLLDYGKSPKVFHWKHGGRTVAVELVNLRFTWKFWLQNNIARLIAVALLLRLVPFRSFRERMIRHNPWLDRIYDADIIGSLAGGDSFSDIYGFRRFIYIVLPQLLVLMLGKPLTLLPQTIGPFKGLAARTIGGFIMRHSERVYARDQESLEEMGSLMGDRRANLTFSYDMAFLLESVPPSRKPDWLARLDRSRPLVGFNVSGLLYMGGYTRNNMFGLKADYKSLVRQIIEHFIEREGANVILVPHVFGAASGAENDTAAAAAIRQELEQKYPGRVLMVSEEYNEREIKYLIGQCDFFLGSRMHSCIAALSQAVPAIGLAYSKKFLGVLRTIGAARLVADLREQDAAEIMARIKETYASRKDIAAGLAQKMPVVRDSVSTLFARTVSAREKARA